MNNISAQEVDNTHHYKNIKSHLKQTPAIGLTNCAEHTTLYQQPVCLYMLYWSSVKSPKILKNVRNMELWHIVCKNKYNFNIIAFVGFTE